jgi:exocyst complex component 2
VSPSLVSRVLTQIVETVAEELSRLMSCVTRFSVEGNQQARADIEAIQEAARLFTTPTAQLVFTSFHCFGVEVSMGLGSVLLNNTVKC